MAKKVKKKTIDRAMKAADKRLREILEENSEKYSLAQFSAALADVVKGNEKSLFEIEGNVWAPYYSNYDVHVQRMVRTGAWGDVLNSDYHRRLKWEWDAFIGDLRHWWSL